jgi:hypothetical protein
MFVGLSVCGGACAHGQGCEGSAGRTSARSTVTNRCHVFPLRCAALRLKI